MYGPWKHSFVTKSCFGLI
uniref:Uncharacterized protein n=1 Tax=Anguilla anguilla TaxID=7936 RepID=A0A0E9PQN6_ANGAN